MGKGTIRRRRSGGSRLVTAVLLLAVLVLLVALTYLGLQHVNNAISTGILENIAANLITASIFTILGVVAFVWLSAIQRRQLFRFFGISRGALDMRVYLSRLQVERAAGIEPVTHGYQGPAIVKMDYDAALLLLDLFQPRALALIPDILRDLLSAIFITLAEVEADIAITPAAKPGLEDFSEDRYLAQNLVTCGSSIYNAVSAYYLRQDRSFYYFTKVDGVRVLKARDPDAPDLASMGRGPNAPDLREMGRSGHELACIQRLKDPAYGTTIFICAGLGAGATYGSVDYLVRNWRRLWRQYGDREFGICLSYAMPNPDEVPTVEPQVLHQTRRLAAQGVPVAQGAAVAR